MASLRRTLLGCTIHNGRWRISVAHRLRRWWYEWLRFRKLQLLHAIDGIFLSAIWVSMSYMLIALWDVSYPRFLQAVKWRTSESVRVQVLSVTPFIVVVTRVSCRMNGRPPLPPANPRGAGWWNMSGMAGMNPPGKSWGILIQGSFGKEWACENGAKASLNCQSKSPNTELNTTKGSAWWRGGIAP